MFAGHTDLVLSRSVQTGEGPAQPSRFWRRLEALCGKETWQTLKTRGLATLALAAQLDEVSGIPSPLGRPAPVPAVPRLPGRLSITAFETLRRDPFAIYARHILRLDALDPIDPHSMHAIAAPSSIAALNDMQLKSPRRIRTLPMRGCWRLVGRNSPSLRVIRPTCLLVAAL